MENKELVKIRELLEFLSKQKIVSILEKLGKDEKRVYALTGEKREVIQAKTKFAAGKISKIWQNLEEIGLIIKRGKSYKKLI